MLSPARLSVLSFLAAAITLVSPADAGETDLVVHGAHVVVRPGVVLEDARVLVRGGRIIAVGTDVEVPEGARVIEGDTVCAGFVDPWSALGIARDSLVDSRTTAATRATDALDVYNTSHLVLEALRAGVTSVRAQAGDRSRVGGVGAVIRLDPELGTDEIVVLEDSNVAMSLGLTSISEGNQQVIEVRGQAITIGQGGSAQKMDPFDRLADMDRIVSALQGAEKYLIDKNEYAHELAEWEKAIAESEAELEKGFKKAKKDRDKKVGEAEEKGKEYKEKRYKEDKKPKTPRFNQDNEVLARVVDGEIPLIVQVHRSAEIRGLLAATEPFDRLRLVLAGCTEAASCADEIAERRIPVILWPALEGVASLDEYDGHDLSLAAQLSDAGVDVLLGSGGRSSSATRDLPLLAQIAVGHGLNPDKALEAISLGAARALDVADRLGSLERGKDADILVLDGEPLASTTHVQYVLSQGRVVVSPEDE